MEGMSKRMVWVVMWWRVLLLLPLPPPPVVVVVVLLLLLLFYKYFVIGKLANGSFEIPIKPAVYLPFL